MMTAATSSRLPSAGAVGSRVHVVTGAIEVPSDRGIRCAANMAARIFSCPQSRPRLGRGIGTLVFAAGKNVEGNLDAEGKLAEEVEPEETSGLTEESVTTEVS